MEKHLRPLVPEARCEAAWAEAAAIAEEDVVLVHAEDEVLVGTAMDGVGAGAGGDEVVAGTAVDEVACIVG
jgi:hypothetical protein